MQNISKLPLLQREWLARTRSNSSPAIMTCRAHFCFVSLVSLFVLFRVDDDYGRWPLLIGARKIAGDREFGGRLFPLFLSLHMYGAHDSHAVRRKTLSSPFPDGCGEQRLHIEVCIGGCEEVFFILPSTSYSLPRWEHLAVFQRLSYQGRKRVR